MGGYNAKLVLLAVLPLALSASFVSCESASSFVNLEVLGLQYRVYSPTDVIVQPATVRRDGNQVTALWKVESSQTPAAYVEWAAQHIREDYSVTSREDSSIVFSKRIEGDVFYLKVTTERKGQGSLVQYTLNAMPD